MAADARESLSKDVLWILLVLPVAAAVLFLGGFSSCLGLALSLSDVRGFGSGFEVIEATLDDAERIGAHLAQAGIYPRRIEPVGSDLEGFFLDLTRERAT